jgi:NAD-dependent SIR2 family protein deacetylase
VAEKLCGRCVRKDKKLDLETRINLAKSIVRDEVYECPQCEGEFYLKKYRVVYAGDNISEKYKSVLK